MAKRAVWTKAAGLFLLILAYYGCSQSAAEDWFRGCYKQTTSTSCFDMTAGDYNPLLNLTGEECVSACSILSSTIKFAGITASGICLCSESEEICLNQTSSNVSCDYPQSDGLYYKVYPVASMPTLDVPATAMVFEEFNVTIGSVDPNCSYTLDFDDGVRIVLSSDSNETTTTHYYASVGEYKLTLSAHPKCMPREVTAKIHSNDTNFANVTLDCPEKPIEVTAKDETVQLSILQGSGLSVTELVSGNPLTTLPDTFVETISFPTLWDSTTGLLLENGTYIVPLLSATNDGILIGIQIGIASDESVTIQILSPVCPAGQKACRGGCVPSYHNCSVQQRSGEDMLSETCCGSVSTYSDGSTKYNVSEEFAINTSELYKPRYIQLPKPVSIKRGDVLAFYVKSKAVIVSANQNGSYILTYCGQRFSNGGEVMVLNATKQNDTSLWFRAHVAVPVVLEMPIEPKLPSVQLGFTVSSVLGHKEVKECTIEVQERIGGLEILKPLQGEYYPTLESITFMFDVTNGTNVTYIVDPGDGNATLPNTTLNHINHEYSERGNYTFNIAASNDINSVNASQSVALYVDIRNLTFVKEPELHHGEVNKTYTVSFMLEAGERPTFHVDFGNNVSLFFSCDDDNLVNKTITKNITYSTFGRYDITVTVYNPFNNRTLNINSTVEIMQPISNLTIYQVNLDDKEALIEDDSIKEHPADKPIILTAKVSLGWPVSYTFSDVYEPGKKPSTNESGKSNRTYKDLKGGIWTIDIWAKNKIKSENRTITITVIDGCESRVEIYDRRTQTEPFKTNLGSDIRIKTEEVWYNESCPKPQYHCWNYTWTLYPSGENLTVVYEPHEKYIFIEKGDIEPGKYRAEMVAVCNETNRTNNRIVHDTYFEVEASDPVAIILGGYERDVPKTNGVIEMDASTSYNPDVKLFNSSGLRFDWSCVENCTNVKLQTTNTSKVQINATVLKVGEKFKVQVVVNTTMYGKVANMTQRIRVVNQSLPTTIIVCRVNCLPLVSRTDRLSLEGQCSSCKHVTFKWIIYESETKVQVKPQTTTGFDKKNLVLSPGTLKIDTKYKVELIATRNDVWSRSIYQFKTSGRIKGGSCEIDPKNGTSALTDFRVECSKWKGGGFPLTYKIRYQSSVTAQTSVSSITDNGKYDWILWYHGPEQVSSSNKLPAGSPDEDYKIPVTVEIYGKFGEYVKVNLSVEVKQQKVDGDNLLEAVNKIDKINGEVEPQKLTQQIIIYSQELNKENSTISEVEIEKSRQSLIEKLSEVKADTLPLIEQASDALTLAADNSEQVPHETQESGIKTLKTMSETLLSIASSSGSRTGQDIDRTARALLSGLSKVLSASLFTGRETSKKKAPEEIEPNLYGTLSKKGADLDKIGRETEDVVEKFDETINHITTAIAKNKLLGETPTVLIAPNFNITLSKRNKNWDNETIRITGSAKNENQGHPKAWISLPKKVLPFLNDSKTDDIFTEVITFEKNPYTWDIKRSHYIQPEVFSFSFRDKNGKKIPVDNLAKDIEIQLPNKKDDIIYRPLNHSVDNDDFLLFSFKVDDDHYQELIMIDVHNTKPEYKKAIFYVKFGEKVSPTNYDFKHQPFQKCRNCSRYPMDIVEQDGEHSIVFIRDAGKVELGNGIVSVGLLPCPDAKKTECDPKNHRFTAFVQTVSCRFWNHTKWIKDGCRVGHKSTPLRTSCFCNHLTAFSSYIVRPNPLNKFSAEDFRQGYVAFIAVIVIFLLYFIFLIWARRADRSDCSKIGVCALADNGAHDRYRYEIAIWTGMRRNAGTRSEVTIILSGEKNDSESRCLINPQNPSFARGSLEKFLLTSSVDIGSLYCIRVWHDNSQGSWYLSRVMVTDLQRDERYYFICDRWLAVDEDDGQVERLLPVASDEELADFHHLFYSKAKRGLSDTHLWVSVLNRPPQSIFTRVQRLSCCLCILMTTMFANALFYQTRSEPTAQTTNFIGSYSFTWDEVYIGIVSSLIIVPVNVVILNIFRNVRPKARKANRRQSKVIIGNLGSGYQNMRKSRVSFETLAESPGQEPRESIAVDTENIYSRTSSAELKNKREQKLSRWARFKKFIIPSSLPHWFVYVGWVILVVITLGSATVVVLYGMQFGNGRSLQWLFSIVVSIAEDIFVLQPLKVLVFALVFALLVRKPDEGEFEMSDYDDVDDDEVQRGDILILGSQSSIPEKKRSPRLPIRPSEEQLAIMRKARMKERKMLFLLQEIIVHLIFTIVIVLVTYGHKDSRSVYLYRHVDELRTMTDKLNSFSDFWNWSRVVLIPKAFPERVYNDRYVPSYGFLDDGYNNLISKARMRLLRVKNDSCNAPDEFKEEKNVCLKHYSISNQDEVCHSAGWNDVKNGKRKTPWCFQNWKDLDGYPTWGIFTTYSGSGYINELIPGKDNNETFGELQSQEWLDKQSRALFVEMTTYNANINLYTSITLLFEFPEFGGIFYFTNIIPMRLKLYIGGFAFFIFACEMVFLVFILGYTYIAMKKFYRQRVGYFKNFWNLMDFAVLMSSFAAIGVYIYRMSLTTRLMERVQDRKGEFVNFQYVTYWNEVLNYIMALVVSLTTVKMTKLMRFNLRISLFGKTLHNAKPALAGFSIQFGIVFFAYVMVGVLVFGYNVSQFKSIASAMMALGRVILGKSQFRELFIADPIIGPFFFFTYVMFVCWILVTMFVAILTDSYHDVQDRCFGMSNEYEIVDFLLARLRAWSGFGGKDPIPASQRWRKAGIKAKAAAKLTRRHSYKPSEENIAFEKTGDLMEKLEDSIRSLEKRVSRLSLHFEL